VTQGRNVWRRCPKSSDVRVPLPLLEELGLNVTAVTPGEIVGWDDRSLYGKGASMLHNGASMRLGLFSFSYLSL
jgi:hypothetical protein